MSLIDEQAAAIQGKSIPYSLSSRISICCLIRGIRYHDGFAQELHGNPKLPMVIRSLNARAIMSNRIPVMTSPEHFLYCFWHPDIPREETIRQLLTHYPGNTLLRLRCVMINDLSWLTDLTPESDLPDLIWYPQVAHEATYRELVRRRPSMIPTVVRACIHADYKDLFATLDVIPDNAELVMDAKMSPNKYYEEYLQHRASERGINLKQILEYEDDWTGKKPHVMLDQDRIERGYGSQAMWLDRELTLDHVGFQLEELATVSPSIGHVLLHASVISMYVGQEIEFFPP
ncbi:hypothetical protein BDW67DRAFT_188524 [Aspergillus spinulosporus]